jgi:prepilin-type N-terminal cleavage/methylation domain-containing protein
MQFRLTTKVEEMKRNSGRGGFTLIEIIAAVAVLGVVIVPLMSVFVVSQNIVNESTIEYKSMLQAQRYMEEIKSMDDLDTSLYIYNSGTDSYERVVAQNDEELGANIILTSNGMIYEISIEITDEGKTVNILEGSKIFY